LWCVRGVFGGGWFTGVLAAVLLSTCEACGRGPWSAGRCLRCGLGGGEGGAWGDAVGAITVCILDVAGGKASLRWGQACLVRGRGGMAAGLGAGRGCGSEPGPEGWRCARELVAVTWLGGADGWGGCGGLVFVVWRVAAAACAASSWGVLPGVGGRCCRGRGGPWWWAPAVGRRARRCGGGGGLGEGRGGVSVGAGGGGASGIHVGFGGGGESGRGGLRGIGRGLGGVVPLRGRRVLVALRAV